MGNIQMVGKSSADMYRGEKPLETKLAPDWTLRRASHATRSTSGSRPRTCRGRSNRVTLRHDGSIALSYTPTNEVPKQRLLHELKAMLGTSGCTSTT